MSCPNIKTHFIKMHDTNFYCCDLLKSANTTYNNIVDTNFTTFMINNDYKYCPFCGQRLSING